MDIAIYDGSNTYFPQNNNNNYNCKYVCELVFKYENAEHVGY